MAPRRPCVERSAEQRDIQAGLRDSDMASNAKCRYYEYWTIWEHLCDMGEFDRNADRGEFYRSLLAQMWTRSLEERECALARYQMEQIWWEDRVPYCKITDEMLDPLIRSKLEIPAGMVRFPHPVMLFRLPVGHGHQGLQYDGGGDISCILATMDERILDGSELGIVLILLHADSKHQLQSAQWMHPDETVGAQLDRAFADEDWSGASEERRQCVANPLRIVTQVSLIVSGAARVEGMEGLVNPDVLARDRDRWYAPKTPTDVRERIRRRAHNGTVIGREVRLPRPGNRIPVAVPTGGATSLTLSHIRCPHFHTYLCGPGRTEIRVKYHGPIVVRPDLPPDPRPKGFKL